MPTTWRDIQPDYPPEPIARIASAGGDPAPLIDTARRVLIKKGDDAHDYKFGCAVLEDAQHISDIWRPRFLAASVFALQGSGKADSPLVKRTRAALA